MLNNYYSLEKLTSRTSDVLNVYIIPLLNMYNVICYSLATIVLSNKNLKGDVNRLLLVFSILGVVVFLISNCLVIVRCGILCPWGYDYVSKFIEAFVFLYICRSLELVALFCQLNILVVKLKAFSTKTRTNAQNRNNKFNKKKFLLTIISYFIISFSFFIIPSLYDRSIVLIGYLVSNQTLNNSNQTVTVTNRPIFILDRNTSNTLFNNVVQFLFPTLILLVYVILMILNSIVIFKLRAFIARKSITARMSSKYS
jgi:hypothetical protein